MKKHTYQVRFSRPVVGQQGQVLSVVLTSLQQQHGTHFPALDAGGDRYQVRDLRKVGRVWQGTFGKLRDDAPHLVTASNEERELALEAGARLLEKCHFLYRELGNLLVWQFNRASGGMARFEAYMGQLCGEPVLVPAISNTRRIEEVLERNIYEVSWSFDRPPSLDGAAPQWNQDQFNTMKQMDAGHAKFDFRAQRGGQLSGAVKAMMRQALGLAGVEKIRVRLTDESDPIELFAAPLKDKIELSQSGRYPAAADVFTALEDAYDRHRSHLGDGAT